MLMVRRGYGSASESLLLADARHCPPRWERRPARVNQLKNRSNNPRYASHSHSARSDTFCNGLTGRCGPTCLQRPTAVFRTEDERHLRIVDWSQIFKVTHSK